MRLFGVVLLKNCFCGNQFNYIFPEGAFGCVPDAICSAVIESDSFESTVQQAEEQVQRRVYFDSAFYFCYFEVDYAEPKAKNATRARI